MSELDKFQPRGLLVLVDPCEKTEKIGSIIVPDRWQTREPEGIVVKVGKGEYRRREDGTVYTVRIQPELKVGVKIKYATHTNRFGAIPIKLDDKKYWLLDERDILMVEEEVET